MTDHEYTSTFLVRSYELDGLGHLNHAVYLNYLEQARYDTLAAAGFTIQDLESKDQAIHVVRIEVDYRRECRYGDRLEVRTAVERFRNSSMILRQRVFRLSPAPSTPERAGEGGGERNREGFGAGSHEEGKGGELALEAKVVAVWIGSNGRPTRIPEAARAALRPFSGE